MACGGTKYYFPPEVLAEMKEKEKIKYYYPYKFDVYCLGIVILRMMNLNKDEIEEIKICKDLSLLNFPRLRKYRKLWPFVCYMLEPDPVKRISSQELKKKLSEFNT